MLSHTMRNTIACDDYGAGTASATDSSCDSEDDKSDVSESSSVTTGTDALQGFAASLICSPQQGFVLLLLSPVNK